MITTTTPAATDHIAIARNAVVCMMQAVGGDLDMVANMVEAANPANALDPMATGEGRDRDRLYVAMRIAVRHAVDARNLVSLWLEWAEGDRAPVAQQIERSERTHEANGLLSPKQVFSHQVQRYFLDLMTR